MSLQQLYMLISSNPFLHSSKSREILPMFQMKKMRNFQHLVIFLINNKNCELFCNTVITEIFPNIHTINKNFAYVDKSCSLTLKDSFVLLMYVFLPGGMKWRSWLRHTALIAYRLEVAGSIPSWVIGFFIDIIF
jgi:hypothetical protein